MPEVTFHESFIWIYFSALADTNCSALSHLHFTSTAGVSTLKDEVVCLFVFPLTQLCGVILEMQLLDSVQNHGEHVN